ncbi:MAG: hypothetical protein H6Q90_1546 [Deltaproteobacteria bacterium]|nr:hypothetical protein [Deltaproteobacteria bacterium]
MSTLEAKLREQLTAAMKAKDSRTSNLVRMINTKIMERRTSKGFTGEVDDALILDVIGTYKKSMEKARVDFANAGERGKDQVAELDFEIEWCSKFLPQGMSEAELREAVAKVVAELPQKDPKMAGRVVGAVKKQFGDRADATLVKKLAEELLGAG